MNKQSIREVWEDNEEIKRLRDIKWSDFTKCLECNDRGYCTVCMMSNSNENADGDPFRINDYHCKVAAMIHKKIGIQMNILE